MTSRNDWQPLRLNDPYLPELPEGGRATVAVVVFPRARESGWSARATAAMARGWCLSGLPTYACDLDLEEPALHTAFGVANGEGISDVLLYGVSARRVAQRVEEGLFLASAGTVAPDPGAVRASPRWDALVDGFQGAGALLLLYVVAGAPGADAVLARADGVVALAGADEAIDLGEAEERLLAVLGPEDSTPSRASPGGAPEPADEEEPEPAASASARAPTADSSGRGCGRLVLIGVLIVVVVVVLVAALGWVKIPGLSLREADATQVASLATPSAGVMALEPGPAATSAGVVPAPEDLEVGTKPDDLAAQETTAPVTDPVQAWAVALESLRALDVAAARVEHLRSRYPGTAFWIAPVRVDGVRYNRVLAGPAETPQRADALGKRLASEAARGGYRVQEARLSFLVGEMDGLAAAREWATSLEDLGVPTHVLRVGHPDGTTAFRVYSGTYASEAEAATLREVLESQGLGSLRLTAHRGVIPE